MKDRDSFITFSYIVLISLEPRNVLTTTTTPKSDTDRIVSDKLVELSHNMLIIFKMSWQFPFKLVF